MQRTDGTYDLPDASVSLVWQSDKGDMARWNTGNNVWYSPAGMAYLTAYGTELKPGRWLPWQPPTFPVPARKLSAIRRCIGKCEQIGTGMLVLLGDSFFCPSKNCASAGWWLKPDQVEVVKWLDPEYEDD